MSFPREYLTFTIWYLQESSLIRMTKTRTSRSRRGA